MRQTFAFLFCLFVFYSVNYAQQQGIPQYANAEARWQWRASSDGITHIPVCWENPGAYVTEMQWVKSAVERTWEAVANVDFYGWGPCVSNNTPGVRIQIADVRPNSHIGTDLNNRRNGMQLNFTFRNFMPSCQAANKLQYCIQSITVHEFGHALGFAHEQDRDDSVCKDSQAGLGNWKVTTYDPDSVMNYCNPHWNNDGRLSAKDIQGVQLLYGARSNYNNAANRAPSGKFYVSDALDPANGQVWESVVMDLNGSKFGSRQFFQVNSNSAKQTRFWNFYGAGRYCYKIWSSTAYVNGVSVKGYGEGCYTFYENKSYAVSLVVKGKNADGTFQLGLQ